MEGEVKAQMTIVAGWCSLYELIKFIPIRFGVLVPDLFSGKCAILVAKHGNESVRRVGRVG